MFSALTKTLTASSFCRVPFRSMSVLAPCSPFKLALVQLGNVTKDMHANLAHARTMILVAASQGANVVVLPECFNSPYGTSYFPEYAEPLSTSASVKMLSETAKEANVYVIGGSIPELDEDGSKRVYNTLTAYNPSGTMIGVHRKVHLFNIDVPGKICFKESDTLTGGDSLTHIDTRYGKIGVGICYDIRFPEMAIIAARKGCMAMIYPGAFNMTTGPLHWELLQRTRALDNQFFVAACSPARDLEASYHAWGHSTVVNPSGAVVATCEEHETIVYAHIDPEEINTIRTNIPLYDQRRFDVYGDVAESVGFKPANNARIRLNTPFEFFKTNISFPHCINTLKCLFHHLMNSILGHCVHDRKFLFPCLLFRQGTLLLPLSHHRHPLQRGGGGGVLQVLHPTVFFCILFFKEEVLCWIALC
ncbi:carbon-nitrogen hydrolase [Spinellus fusiger]|nr:carbon-nitrogen hydrolase [Spinellus fusiger]